MQNSPERFFEEQTRPHIYAYTEPQFEKAPWTGARSGKGIIKVGYTTKDVKERTTSSFLVKGPHGKLHHFAGRVCDPR